MTKAKQDDEEKRTKEKRRHKGYKSNIPHRNTSMDDPLENDIYTRPQNKVCYSKEREPLEGNNTF